MNSESIFISLSPEVFKLLTDNGINLIDELQKRVPQVSRDERTTDPSKGAHNQTKEVTLVILASGAAFYAVCMGIERIINAIGNNKKPIVEETILAPIHSQNGEVIRDENNRPILQWVKKKSMLESQKTIDDNSKMSASFGGLKGIKVELQNERKQE